MGHVFRDFELKVYIRELARPWKVFTLLLGMGYYIWGSMYYACPTWDVPISIIMSALAYLVSPWVVDSTYNLVVTRPGKWGWGLFRNLLVVYMCASGVYEIYNLWNLGYWPPPTYWVNLYYSSLMFFAAGMVWRFKGTARELISELVGRFRLLIS